MRSETAKGEKLTAERTITAEKFDAAGLEQGEN
jgi:hypothetical protein